jgi:DNA helicase MCM8
MKYLKSQCIGKFVSVKGTVIRVSTIKPVLIEMKFLCTKCGFETLQRMTEGKFEAPVYCSQVRFLSLSAFSLLLPSAQILDPQHLHPPIPVSPFLPTIWYVLVLVSSVRASLCCQIARQQ